MRREVRRQIAYTQNWHSFCQKYNIIPSSDDSIEMSICEALKYIAVNNELKRADNNDGYIKMDVYFKDVEVVSGYFTVKQINDITFLDSRIKML